MPSVKNAVYTKEYNRLQILRLLRQQPASRAELARATGLTRAAISLITEELIAEGLVKESATVVENHARGRMPVLLKLCPDAMYAVGIYLTRFDCCVGICDFRGSVILQKRMRLPQQVGELLDLLVGTVEQLIAESGLSRDKLLGVGISAPGPVDRVAGVILNPPEFDAFHDLAIGSSLQERLGLNVWLENDANAAALHNYMDGQFAGKENFLLLMVDSGVGSGVIWNGKLLHSCELGHVSIDHRGTPCACGSRGCLETYASTSRIMKQYPQYESWEQLVESKDGQGALKKQAEYLAAGIVNFTNILPVETVLLCGQLGCCAGYIAPMIRAELRGKTLALGKMEVSVLPALCDPDRGLQEACCIVIGRFLQI